MTEKLLTSDSFKCHYCHQKTFMEIIGAATRELDQNISGSNEVIGISYPLFHQVEATWNILICPNCDNANILLAGRIDGEIDGDTRRIIYPPAITYTAPDEIDLQFRSAIGVSHNSPAAAVNQFRVILEMIWQHRVPKGTKKPALRGKDGMIGQLVARNILYGIYADMADILANIGNKGSHNDEIEVTEKDAEMARRLCQIILEHVYRMRPEGIDLIQQLENKFPRESGWRDGQYVDKNNW